jgi:hypothetical protein
LPNGILEAALGLASRLLLGLRLGFSSLLQGLVFFGPVLELGTQFHNLIRGLRFGLGYSVVSFGLQLLSLVCQCLCRFALYLGDAFGIVFGFCLQFRLGLCDLLGSIIGDLGYLLLGFSKGLFLLFYLCSGVIACCCFNF